MNNLPQRLLLVVFASTAGLLSVGQMVPSDTSQVAAGETLPQVLLWLVTWSIFVLALLLSGSLKTMSLSGRRLATSNELQASGENTQSETDSRRNVFGYWFIAAILFTIAWVFIAAWHVYGVGNFRFALNGWWQWVAWFAAFFMIFRLIQIGGTAVPFVKWMLALCFLVSLHGCYQVFISIPLDQERFRNDPQAVLAEAGIEAAPGSSTYMLFEGRLRDSAPTGPFALTNSLAGFLLPWLVVLFALGLHKVADDRPHLETDSFNTSSGGQAIAAWMVGILMLWVLVLTQSRTAWIALFIGCLICVANHPRIRIHLRRLLNPFSVAFVFLVVGVIGLIYQWDRKLVLEAPQSLVYRLEYWQTTLRMASDHGWAGVGPGNFQAYYATYKSLESSETVADPHHFLLETLGTAGFPAFIGLVTTIVCGLAIGWSYRKKDTTDSTRISRTRPKDSVDAVSISVYFGGVVGLLLVWFSLGVLGPLPTTTPYWLGTPVVILYFGWTCYREHSRSIETSSLPPKKHLPKSSELPLPPRTKSKNSSLPGVGAAIIALLVHLSASGGWMTPGVGNSLALLVAVWLAEIILVSEYSSVASFIASRSSDSPRNRETFGSWLAAIGAVTPILLLLVFYYSTWLPTQKLKSLQNRLQDSSIPITIERLEDLVASDTWDPFPSRFLADMAYREAMEDLSRRPITSDVVGRQSAAVQSLTNARKLAYTYREKDRANWQSWHQSGQWELAVAAYNPESLNTSLQFFQEASKRAPSELGLLTQVALVAWIANDLDLAKQIWSQAADLQQRITHVDRKLFGASLYWPASVGPKSTRLPPSIWQKIRDGASISSSSRAGWVRAEPVFDFLRTQLDKPDSRK